VTHYVLGFGIPAIHFRIGTALLHNERIHTQSEDVVDKVTAKSLEG
jgi:hypothetical protein